MTNIELHERVMYAHLALCLACNVFSEADELPNAEAIELHQALHDLLHRSSELLDRLSSTSHLDLVR